MNSQPSWKRPPGVSPTVAHYLADPRIAENYEQTIAGDIVASFDIPRAISFFDACSRVCDLGCGTGRLCRALAERGVEVLGVDLSPEMLRVATRNCAAVASKVTLVRANLVQLEAVRGQIFDGAACLFSTLGMIHGRTERLAVIQHAYRVLKPGGKFLLHAHNLWHHLRSREGRKWLLRDRLRAMLGDETAGDCDLPQRFGSSAPALHHFRLGELRHLIRSVGFAVAFVEPITARGDGRMRWPWAIPGLRAYGFLLGAVRPG